MSVYDNDKRLYPPLDDMIASAPPSPPDEGHLYRLKK